MNQIRHLVGLLSIVLASLMLGGCSTPTTNPASPRSDLGYVDFYTDSDQGLMWAVKRWDAQAKEFRSAYSKFEAVPGNTLRLTSPSGSQRFQVELVDRFTEGPVEVEVLVQNSQVTPVRIILTPTGTTSADRKNYRFGASAKGYGRGTKITSEEGRLYRVSAETAAPRSYLLKEQMPYWADPKP